MYVPHRHFPKFVRRTRTRSVSFVRTARTQTSDFVRPGRTWMWITMWITLWISCVENVDKFGGTQRAYRHKENYNMCNLLYI